MLIYRQATAKGDLVLTWAGRSLRIEGRLATERERQLLREWAKKHELSLEGSLADQATVDASPETLRAALSDLVTRGVGEAGYMVYVVNRRGKGRALYNKAVPLNLDEVAEVNKVPQVSGG